MTNEFIEIKLKKRPFFTRLWGHYWIWRKSGMDRWLSFVSAFDLARL